MQEKLIRLIKYKSNDNILNGQYFKWTTDQKHSWITHTMYI